MQLGDVNLTDPMQFAEGAHHEMFALLRREAPVFWHEESDGPGFWAITKHADVKDVSCNPVVFSSERKGSLIREMEPQNLPFVRQIMLNMDPPRHGRYRALVNRAFTPRIVETLREQVRDVVRKTLNGVIERGECEAVSDVAAVLPLEMICGMMGVPPEDRRRVADISNMLVGFEDPELQPDGIVPTTGDADTAAAEMFMYAAKLRDSAQRRPTGDLASALVHAEIDGEKLSETEFQFFFLQLLLAGNETTRTVTANGLILLLEHPDQLRALRHDPSLVGSAVEETLRYEPAVHSFRRQTTRQTEIRGQRIEADQKVVVWYPSANRDEDVFVHPHRFDVRRQSNDHIAFGVGEHYCLGASLARMELREMFAAILARVHDIEMVEPPRRLHSTFVNGVKELRVRFRPAAPVH